MSYKEIQMQKLRRFLFWNQKLSLADVQRILEFGKTRANDYFIRLKKELSTSLKKVGHDYVVDTKTLEKRFDFTSEDLLAEFQLHPEVASAFGITSLSVDPLLKQQVDARTLRYVLQALREKKGLEIDYVAAQSGAIKSRRIIDPLGLFYINNRWHIHAYCRNKRDSRDFVLSRIIHVYTPHERRHPSLAPSINKMLSDVAITITTHPALSEDQVLVIRRMYRFEGADRILTMPRYKLFYFRKLYLCEENEGPPDKFLIEK